MPAKKKTTATTARKKAAAKKTAKKTAKKPTAKKTARKTTKKAAAKKTAAKKTAAKKTAAKKTATKKTAAKKAAAKQTTKKTAAKKTAKKTGASTKVGGVTVKGTRHDPPMYLLILLPVGLTPWERAERFEDPLEDALGALGAVSGGGTSFGESGVAESSEIEVEVNDVIRALPIIRRVLVEQQAPAGSVITRLTRTGAFEVLFELGS